MTNLSNSENTYNKDIFDPETQDLQSQSLGRKSQKRMNGGRSISKLAASQHSGSRNGNRRGRKHRHRHNTRAGHRPRDALDRFLDYFANALEHSVRFISPLFVFLAICLIVLVIWIILFDVYPIIFPGHTFTRFIHLFFAMWLIFNILFNYFMVITTSPGVPYATMSTTNDNYCGHCNTPKPDRTHHCSICQSCTYRFDHHCPWIMNCVGHFNHRYFLLFLFYLFVGCIYVLCCTGIPFYLGSLGLQQQHAISYGQAWRPTPFFAFVLSISISLAVGSLLSFHSYLALTNQTTVEFYENRHLSQEAAAQGTVYSNPFDLGYKENFCQFFNVDHWYWFWLPSLKPMKGDGINYTTNGFTPHYLDDSV